MLHGEGRAIQCLVVVVDDRRDADNGGVVLSLARYPKMSTSGLSRIGAAYLLDMAQCCEGQQVPSSRRWA